MKAAILGVGLIGGSLALCLKERTSCHVSGYDLSQKTLDWAVAAGVIDEGSRDLEEAVEDADFIFLAVPVGTIPELLSRLERQPLLPGASFRTWAAPRGAGSLVRAVPKARGDIHRRTSDGRFPPVRCGGGPFPAV